MKESILAQRLERAENKVRRLEELVENRSRALYEALDESRKNASFLQEVAAAMPVSVIVYNHEGRVTMVNKAAQSLLGYREADMVSQLVSRFFSGGTLPATLGRTTLSSSPSASEPVELQTHCVSRTGEQIPVLISARHIADESGSSANSITVCTLQDLREDEQKEANVRQAQKLETLGRLTAGVAHEINTPAQYVSDSIYFLRDTFDDLNELISHYESAANASSDDALDALGRAADFAEEIDLEYVRENTPRALERAADGLERIGGMCQSIKEFSHPDGKGKAPDDLNRRIKSAAGIARNEYKYVADLALELGDIPLINCHGDEISQTVLNLIINAAHAIGERVAGRNERGSIVIHTAVVDDNLVIEVRDDGNGIPEHLKEKIFGAFFTTKPIGKGTGQGLALARSTVVERHNGSLDVDSEVGKGTTFRITLPLAEPTVELAI